LPSETRQFQSDHSGSAVFFASRARRIADGLNDEARRVANTPGVGFIHGARVNLRAGPSKQHEVLTVLDGPTPVFRERRDGNWLLVRTSAGMVGWIHVSLLRDNASRSSQTQTQSLPASLAR
jgi:SH3-like domain-containing protein